VHQKLLTKVVNKNKAFVFCLFVEICVFCKTHHGSKKTLLGILARNKEMKDDNNPQPISKKKITEEKVHQVSHHLHMNRCISKTK